MSFRVQAELEALDEGITPVVSHKQPKTETKPSSLLVKVLEEYRSRKSVKVQMQQIVRKTLMGKETKGEGALLLSQGKLRWDYTTPEKTLVLFDGKVLWTVQYPPAEMKIPPQVTKTHALGPKKDPVLFSLFLGKHALADVFDVVSENVMGPTVVYDLKSRQKNSKLQKLQMQINKEKNLIQQIKYTDDAENETELNFKETVFGDAIKKSQFEFSPPKGAQINEL